jgi:acyl dehydratase
VSVSASVPAGRNPFAPLPRLYWEDMEVGVTYSTPSRTVTEADVVAFASLTADFNRMHVDAEYAGRSSFGQRIAHGLLVASISAGLNTRSVANQRLEETLAGLLDTRLSFRKPTFIGDTIRVDVEVVDRRETSRAERGIVVLKRTTWNQRDELVLEAVVTMLMLRRPAADEQR